ncbi:hypothetical protein Acr_17g0011760 [Actinidia rufa]|uniref:Uncharacterized protein n=1 Tax=Actinidia rufa TaxID=165716 RepID=A0A7J0G477_9ERIC|nr:hypothetical protein Acr_17g0011760 [Actinidia rufa]
MVPTQPVGYTEPSNTSNSNGLIPTSVYNLPPFTLMALPCNGTDGSPSSTGLLPWANFTATLLCRFGPTDFDDSSEGSHALETNHNGGSTLTEAIGVARLIEERNNLQNRSNPPFRNQPSTPPHLQHSNATTTITPTAGLLGPPPHLESTPIAETSPPPFKRLTNQEACNRQEKGLCFYCDEKYKPEPPLQQTPVIHD